MPNLLNNIYKILESLGFDAPYNPNKPGIVAHKALKASINVSLLDGMVLLTLKTPKKSICGALPAKMTPEIWVKEWVKRRLEEVKHG